MEIIKKRESLGIPTFGELEEGDVFLSTCAEEPDVPYMKTDDYRGFSDGGAINLNSGYIEGFENTDAVVKVKATLTIE